MYCTIEFSDSIVYGCFIAIYILTYYSLILFRIIQYNDFCNFCSKWSMKKEKFSFSKEKVFFGLNNKPRD